MWGIDILAKLLDTLPRPARVTAFFLILIISIYLVLLPQFVNGYVYFKDENGGKLAYRGGEIVVAVDGHVYKYVINETGYFSVPMISKLPKSLRLGFVHKDTGGRYDVDLPFKRITGPGELDFEVKFDPPSVKIVEVGFTDAGRNGRSLAWELGGIAHADAAELNLPEGTIKLEKTRAGDIKHEVLNIIAREAKKPEASLNNSTDFTWTNGFPYIVKIRIVDAVERKYGFRVPDDHWQAFRTVGEVVDYTQKRIVLDKFKSSDGITWPEYQNQISREAPLFVK